MKKILLIAAIAFASVASAQKGTILVAGSIGLSSSKGDNTTTENKFNNLNFSPKVGYQFTDHWTLGLDASISSQKSENTTTTSVGPGIVVVSSNEIKTTGFSAGPFARYTMPISETFNFFADMGFGFQSQKETVDNNNGFGTVTSTENKGDGIYVGITPAIFINVKKSFGLNVSIGGIGYETLNFDSPAPGVPGRDTNGFNFSFGQTINIGISKNF
jgi:Outer membrane protein beta-barrel domain